MMWRRMVFGSGVPVGLSVLSALRVLFALRALSLLPLSQAKHYGRLVSTCDPPSHRLGFFTVAGQLSVSSHVLSSGLIS